jgi:hypothetical protein
MRSNYWTCSKFADWLRGTPIGGAKTSEDWDEWRKTAQAKHPVRYWLADEGLDYIQNFLMWPIDKIYNVKYYINNRWVTRTHCLTAHPRDIKPGQWMDVGYRFLPCLFNELVEYVETELAWWHIAWDEEARKKYKSPFWASGWFRWRTWRCPEAGLESLAWQMKCTNEDFLPEDKKHEAVLTYQAIAAKEIHDLYIWWTVERPKRVDPMEASGWSDYCNRKHEKGISVFKDLTDDKGGKIDTKPMLDLMTELEAKYEKEDEDMMIRLIKIRQALWT